MPTSRPPSTPIPHRIMDVDVDANDSNSNRDAYESSPPSRSSPPPPPTSGIILKIASYLSIHDAESMASLSRGSVGIGGALVQSQTSLLLPGYHSLDAWCGRSGSAVAVTSSSSSSSVAVQGGWIAAAEEENDAAATMTMMDSHAPPHYQQTLSSIMDEEDDEGWFVGDGCPAASVTLSPTEEWSTKWRDAKDEDEEEADDDPGRSGSTNEGRGHCWTPAGEPTCERNDGVVTPALTVVSPNGREEEEDDDDDDNASHASESSFYLRKQHRLRKRALQHKLAQAVFAHPHPLKDYCLDAYATAVKLSRKRQRQQQQQQQQIDERRLQEEVRPNPNPETLRHCPSSPSRQWTKDPELGEHVCRDDADKNSGPSLQQHPHSLQMQRRKHSKQRQRQKSKLLRVLLTKLLDTIPISVLLDLLESTLDLSIETLLAMGNLTTITFTNLLTLLSDTLFHILSALSSINVFELVLSAHRSVNKTGEVLASGLHSVATGVGSASNAALEKLSRQGLALAGAGLSRGGGGGMILRGGMMSGGKGGVEENPLESKLFRRLHKMDHVSKLVAYSERMGEEAFGRAQKKRAQRMMHYNVSFRPFTATIQPASPKKAAKPMKHSVSFELSAISPLNNTEDALNSDDNDSVSSESLYSNSGSIFMRTPTSFPPTPTSRLYYFERGSRFTENVIFLARDQLRVERGLDNANEQTRAMSKALREGSRLAVFDAAADGGGGIALSCGQHIATKVGNALYCSTRSMIPVMRNSFVYFEISVSPPPTVNEQHRFHPQFDIATLAIGLSTLEMPLNTLVGAWKGSVGLCTTGQVLMAGQWFAPADTQESSYGSNSTVGCLVYLDDSASHDTREGPMVTADVTFNVNGIVIPPLECSRPLGPQHLSSSPTCSSPSAQPYDDMDDVPTLSLIVPRNQELFPTVTLHSPATCVMCRFNAEDLLANSRAEIGAPEGVTVFSVDGSIIIDPSAGSSMDQDDLFVDSSDDLTQFTHDEVAL
eukprot:CCRYP_000051-RA/>CCRYP_000051-RA protein AED:0.08 eAED:0.12 QI:0/1/0.5/1/1/1/2/176/995